MSLAFSSWSVNYIAAEAIKTPSLGKLRAAADAWNLLQMALDKS